MQHLAQSLEKAISQHAQAGEVKQIDFPQNTQPKLNARNKEQLSKILGQVCALQKAYGKTQAELETLVEGFAWALSEYEMPEIFESMRNYIKTNNDIPAPADLIKIMDRNREWEKHRNPPIETLIRYRKKGIPLSESDKEKLTQYDRNNDNL